ncbi:MAG: tRNA (adenosine(37)-N6)-dimethylallyltransferase MiaA [Candidatus Eisenbacteria bacterium]|nr:tRNA (adenosine(37)-N6)-dimethylallyltransferase MiaA [Candidatus Eisenbacteria bacterium]
MNRAPLVVAVVGATATGKTDLAEALAARLDAEIVCADSRQVFRQLEIGTGKPAPALRALRPHHLFDALALGERASAGWYARAARAAGAAIHARGRVPLLVGGSGLYLAAARRGLAEEPPHDPALRARLREQAASHGPGELHRRLALADPETAARVKPRDTQRITRALEVLEASGRPLSWWHARPRGPAVAGEWRMFELIAGPAALAARIETRTRWMFGAGLVEETRALLAAGHQAALAALRAVGYDEAMELVAGRMTRREAEERTSLRTRQLAKRQRTWFRHQVEAVRIPADAVDVAGWTRAILAELRA